MFKTRLLTGLIAGAVFFIALFAFNALGFTIFITLVVLSATWEWSNLSGFKNFSHRVAYCLLTIILMAIAFFYVNLNTVEDGDTSTLLNTLIVSGAWWAVALLWVQGYPSSALIWGSRWARAVIGWLVLIPGWLALIYLHQSNQGPWLIVVVALTVIVADSGAYVFGRAFGRHRLAKSVSPGKSWEGFFGGVFCCVLLSLILSWLTSFDYWPLFIAIILPTALASVLGDLLESMLKRHRGIKDSGRILPGHGGILDRVDSFTAAAPIFALGILISGWEVPFV